MVSTDVVKRIIGGIAIAAALGAALAIGLGGSDKASTAGSASVPTATATRTATAATARATTMPQSRREDPAAIYARQLRERGEGPAAIEDRYRDIELPSEPPDPRAPAVRALAATNQARLDNPRGGEPPVDTNHDGKLSAGERAAFTAGHSGKQRPQGPEPVRGAHSVRELATQARCSAPDYRTKLAAMPPLERAQLAKTCAEHGIKP